MKESFHVPRELQRMEGCASNCGGWDFHRDDCPILAVEFDEIERRMAVAQARVDGWLLREHGITRTSTTAS